MSNNTLVGTRRASIEPQTRADRTPPGHGVYRSARRRTAVVAVFYTLLYLIYFSPALISGRLLAPGDGVAYSLPVYLSPKSSWTPLLFSGYPLLADPQVMGFYPVARLLALFPNSWNLFVLSAYILASVWTFCLVRALTRSDFGALIGGTLYGMSGFFMAHLGHTNMIHSAAWLPLILLAAVKLRTRYSPAWLAAGAFAVAMSILAGHPQIAVYALGLTAAYALSRGWYAPAGRWRYGLALAAMVLLGVGLSAVQLLPAQELAKLSPRAAMDYLNHIHPNVPPRQLMTLLFPYLLGEVWDSIYHLPYVGVFNIAEVSGYVGLLPLMLVMIAVLRRRAGAEVWFWAIVAIVALMLATGGATPLAHLTHLLPGYRSFRAPSRHLLEFTLAMSILAGFGVAHLQDCPARRRRELWAVGLFILGFFAVLAAILLGHQRIAGIFLRQASLSWTSHPLKNNAVGIPILVALAGSMAMALWILRPRRWSQAVLLTVLVGDLATFGWVCEWNNPHAPTAQGLQMPASLAHYRQAAESESQRVLALRGMFASPAEAKPNLPMLWGMRSSGGYSPLRPWRYQRLLGMNEVGVLALDWAADPAEPVLATGRALDLLATRYVLGPSHQSRREGFLDRDGRSYAPEDLPTALLRRSDETPPAQAAFEVSPFHATEIDLVTNLKGGRELPDGAPVLAVRVWTAGGQEQVYELRAGEHTAEQVYDPTILPAIKHCQPGVFQALYLPSGELGHSYRTIFRFHSPQDIAHLELQSLAPPGVTVCIPKITLFNEPAAAFYLLDSTNLLAGDESRWKLVHDGPEASIIENRHPLPRAFLTWQTWRGTGDEVLWTIHNGRRPDGESFDPRGTALLHKTLPDTLGPVDEQASVRITAEQPASLELKTSSQTPAFLVIADASYPGWRAYVDGQRTTLYQTDYILRGLTVPAGEHRIELRYHPKPLYTGSALSLASLLILATVVFAGARSDHARRRLMTFADLIRQ